MEASNRGARLALLAAVLAFPAVMLVRVCASETPAPGVPEPAWVHLLVLTGRGWPGASTPGGSAFEAIERRGVRLAPIFAPSDSAASSAVSLWTGRWPRSHGVTSADRALPAGAWTLAGAARAGGAATAAFLEEPFVTVTGIEGFGERIEHPELDADFLARTVETFYAAHADERTVVWVHLADVGPEGARLARTLADLQRILGDGQHRLDTLTVVAGLSAAPGPYVDAGAIVPLFLELPTTMSAGSASAPHLSLVDLTGFVARIMRLSAGARDVQSRTVPMQNALGGVQSLRPVELWIDGAPVYRRGPVRVLADGDVALVDGLLSKQSRPLAGAEADALRTEAAEFRAELDAAATPARPAERTPTWRDWR